MVDIRTNEAKPSLWKRLALLYGLQGASYSMTEIRRAYHMAVQGEIDSLAKGQPQVSREEIDPDILRVFQALYEAKGVFPAERTLRDTAVSFRALSLEHLRLYPGAMEVLTELRSRGKGVYLLSNAQAAFTEPELRLLGLTPRFDGIVLSSQVGQKKPARAMFSYLLSTYGLDPAACLMVGNDAVADIQGAAGAGLRSRYIHTKQSPDPPASLPDSCRRIDSLLDLIS
ncbi:MAG: HAD family hydrolase [Clostridia bacterium]|nr:HAD family hydrolase [Clostridia bacterium]